MLAIYHDMSQQDCSKTVRQLSAHKIREYRLIDSYRQLGGCVTTSLNPTRNARADTQGRRCQSIFTDFIFFHWQTQQYTSLNLVIDNPTTP